MLRLVVGLAAHRRPRLADPRRARRPERLRLPTGARRRVDRAAGPRRRR
ncbi:MAG: hypothetical protein U5R31_06490 [Acidimicrobiia bacterium]|nr:hypothetical protein [Acidimicrobiia bacterium]